MDACSALANRTQIKLDDEFHELVLKERPGRRTHAYMTGCNIEELYKAIIAFQKQPDRRAIQLPYHLKGIGGVV